MAEGERDAAMSAVASLYDAVPGPFGILSVPADRPPHEHLAQIEERLDGSRARAWFRAYVALYREAADGARRPVRRTFLHLDAASETELGRSLATVRRVAEDAGVVFRDIEPAELADIWAGLARAGETFRVGPRVATGSAVIAAVGLGRHWPSEVAPGWLAPLLATDGLAAASLRVRPLSRAEAMHFLTVRLRHVRAAERLARERGELDDVARERLGETATAGRRAVHAGAGRIYLVDAVLLVEAPDQAALGERLEVLRLEGRGLELDVEPATFRLADAWRACLPGPAPTPIAERNLDSASLAASLLHAASDLYEPSGHLYGVARTSGAPIVLDRFAHTSHSAIVLGQTGTGKTMFTGAEIGRCVLRGIPVLAIDPIGDYRRLTEALGGTYVELGAGGGLNPFILAGDRTPAALAAKLATLSPSRRGDGRRPDARRATGPRRRPPSDLRGGRHRRRPGHSRPPTAPTSPTWSTTSRAGQAVHRSPIGSGAGRAARWPHCSRPTSRCRSMRRLLVVGFDAISDPEVRAVAQFAALSVLWDAVRRDKKPKLVVVDEAWKVMRQPSGAEFVEELARSARHYHAGLQLSTQDIAEFLRSDFGEAIVKQCDIRVLLGQTPEAADALARYFDLTPSERRSLVHARPGEGLLFVGRSHVAFEARVSAARIRTLTTRPADLVGQSHSRFAPPIVVRRAGCGCAATGCAVPLVCRSSSSARSGSWPATGRRSPRPSVPDAPPAVADIPPDYLVLYRDAAARFGLDWPVLAAVGRVETNHGRNRNGCDPNSAGARGPMQFLEPTFVHAASLAGITDPDICDPADAIPAAAAYLKSNGAPDRLAARPLPLQPGRLVPAARPGLGRALRLWRPASSGRSRAAGSARASGRRRSPSSRPSASRASATTTSTTGSTSPRRSARRSGRSPPAG